MHALAYWCHAHQARRPHQRCGRPWQIGSPLSQEESLLPGALRLSWSCGLKYSIVATSQARDRRTGPLGEWCRAGLAGSCHQAEPTLAETLRALRGDSRLHTERRW